MPFAASSASDRPERPSGSAAAEGVERAPFPGPATRYVRESGRSDGPAAPLISYDVIFPGDVAPQGPRAGFILNLTNDGWFGQTSGPYQHLAQARLRSIEEGLPLVRVANTGISGVVDAYGRLIASLPLGTEGVLDSALPRAGPVTLYARLADAVFAAMLLLFLGIARLRLP